MPIERLKETLDTCYKTILRLIVAPEKVNNANIETFVKIKWEDTDNENSWILENGEFIQLTSEINGFSDLRELDQKEQKTFSEMFKKFSCKILNQLPLYLPISDQVRFSNIC